MAFLLSSCLNTGIKQGSKTIFFNLDNGEQIKLSTIFNDKAEYIKLESPVNHLIGDVNKIIVTGKYIIIGDYYNTISVYIFKKSGEFISQISAVGQGPFEYNTLQDFYFDEHKKEIGIFAIDGKCVVYNLDGKGLKEYYTGVSAVKYHKQNNNILISGQESEYCLKLFEPETGKSSDFIELTNKIANSYGPYKCFATSNESTFYIPNLSQTIYRINGNIVKPIYNLDFGKHNVSKKLLQNFASFDEYLFYCKKNNLVNTIDRIANSKKYLQLTYSLGDSTCFSFYDKISGKTYSSTIINNDIDGLNFYGPKAELNNAIVQTRWTKMIKENINKIKNKLSEENWQKYEACNKNLISLLENTDETNNPIVIIYFYK
jgi:hypothetical protein